MKKNIKKWRFAGMIFTIVLGSFLHFVYEWSGNNTLVGIFGAVNESIWEHLKLLFWPAFIFSIVEWICIGKYYNNYITAKAISFYVGIMMIITLFYTYTGVIGKNYIVLDISIFLISVIISQYLGYKIITSNTYVKGMINIISVMTIALLVFAFIQFTYNPPSMPLFQVPSKVR